MFIKKGEKAAALDLDDNAVVDCIQGGQHELFSLLIERHQKHVHALGMSFLRNVDDSEDFSQEVFVKAFQNLDQFEGRSKFSTWLYRLAYNTAINNINRRKEYISLAETEEIEGFMLTPEEENIREAVRQSVRQAVEQLPEKYRLCIDLFFFYDCSYEEIEAITGNPVNTIKSHVFRAKKLLRKKLESI